jgi:hypothetical protein
LPEDKLVEEKDDDAARAAADDRVDDGQPNNIGISGLRN